MNRRRFPQRSWCRDAVRSFGCERTDVDPSLSFWMSSVSPAFNPAPTTQRFGSEIRKVDFPASWSLRPSIRTPSHNRTRET